MSRFVCLADQCPETCCSGLRVPVKASQFHRIRELAAGGPLAEMVANAIHHEEGDETASIVMKRDGDCPFFDADKLCRLQKAHGVEALPDICATFPRVSWRVGSGIESSGTLACPEVARQVLLTEDGVQPEEFVPSQDEERLVAADEHVRLQKVRAVLQALLQRMDYPLSSRLAFAAQLGFVLQQHGASLEEDALDQALSLFGTEEVLEKLHGSMLRLTLPTAPTLGLYASLLRNRLHAGRGPRFEGIARPVLKSYGLEHDDAAIAKAADLMAERRAWLEQTFGVQLSDVFLRACTHEFFRLPNTEDDGVLDSVLRLALRLGVVRTVLLGHPTVVAAFEAGRAARSVVTELEAAVVDSFQLVARHIEQSPEMLSLMTGLNQGGPQARLGRALVFAAY